MRFAQMYRDKARKLTFSLLRFNHVVCALVKIGCHAINERVTFFYALIICIGRNIHTRALSFLKHLANNRVDKTYQAMEAPDFQQAQNK